MMKLWKRGGVITSAKVHEAEDQGENESENETLNVRAFYFVIPYSVSSLHLEAVLLSSPVYKYWRLSHNTSHQFVKHR